MPVLTDPMVHPQVRQSVEAHGVPTAEAPRSQDINSKCDHDTKIAHGNEWSFATGEDIGIRVEVKLLVSWRFRAVAPGQAVDTGAGIHKDICGPTKDLVEK